jgi:hypothetical protein
MCGALKSVRKHGLRYLFTYWTGTDRERVHEYPGLFCCAECFTLYQRRV